VSTPEHLRDSKPEDASLKSARDPVASAEPTVAATSPSAAPSRAAATTERPVTSTTPAEPEASAQSGLQGYVANLHLPLVVVLLFLTVTLGAIGFGLRPGTDRPPPVPRSGLTLAVYEQASPTAAYVSPTSIFIDESLMQATSSVVELQLDLYAEFRSPGRATWEMLTGLSQAQPLPCPNPYSYLGTAYGNPVGSQNARATVMGQPATAAVIANLVGLRMHKTASNILGLTGQSAGSVKPGHREPLALIDLCWTSDPPLAFDGEYASAAIPTIGINTYGSGPPATLYLTRSLYFENKLENVQPVTSEYTLQAGIPFTSSDPFGWHWLGNPGTQIQLTALNIPVSQHESYLGFLSGVLFGVAGGAFVSLLQESLSPLRRRSANRSQISPAPDPGKAPST
jgi:hypothetical protein